MIAPYGRLLARRGVRRLVLIDLLAKLGTPVLSLALLLAAVDGLGSYAPAGLVLTGHALCLALCAPIGGRLADRLGARCALAGYLIVHAITYALLVIALLVQARAPVLIGTAALLGVTSPPAGAVIRAVWRGLVPDESLSAAYALDSAINELMFIFGPVLVSALMLVMSARGVVVVAGASVLLGTALLLASQGVRHVPPERKAPRQAAVSHRLAGPLTHRPTLVLLLLAAFGTFSFGCLRIATVASATTFGSASSAGVLMGLLSAGALIGGLLYGSRTWNLSGRRLLILLSLIDSAGMSAGAFAPGLLALAVVITATGLLTGPRDTLQTALLAENVSAEYRTEAFAWLNTFMWAGYGVGTAVAGNLTGPGANGAAAFIAAAAVALVGAVLAATGYHPPRHPHMPLSAA